MSRSHSKHSAGRWRGRSLCVLVDMDGVLCDFEGWFLKVFREQFPDDPFVPLDQRNTFYIDQQYFEIRHDLKDKSRGIINAEGFFRNLPPIDGAIDALKEMSGVDGVDVFLCTSPLTTTTHSVKEKFEWVQEHLGRDWMRKTIITSDKTVISGDILIDDRPKVKGVMKNMSWDHILFTSCSNEHLDISRLPCKQRLDNWTDGRWREIIEQYKRKL